MIDPGLHHRGGQKKQPESDKAERPTDGASQSPSRTEHCASRSGRHKACDQNNIKQHIAPQLLKNILISRQPAAARGSATVDVALACIDPEAVEGIPDHVSVDRPVASEIHVPRVRFPARVGCRSPASTTPRCGTKRLHIHISRIKVSEPVVRHRLFGPCIYEKVRQLAQKPVHRP